MLDYSIGGQERGGAEGSEGIADIPKNRTLMVQKLTADAPVKPEVVKGLKTVEDVFDHYKPEVDVEFEGEEGASVKETFHFKNVGDFGKKGIVQQSKFLQDTELKQEQYQKFVKQLRTNKILKSVLENEDTKQNYIDALKALIQEIEESGS